MNAIASNWSGRDAGGKTAHTFLIPRPAEPTPPILARALIRNFYSAAIATGI